VSVVGVAGWPVILTGWPVTVAWSSSQEQTLSGTRAHVYTAHRGWLGVVMGISAASTGGLLVWVIISYYKCSLMLMWIGSN